MDLGRRCEFFIWSHVGCIRQGACAASADDQVPADADAASQASAGAAARSDIEDLDGQAAERDGQAGEGGHVALDERGAAYAQAVVAE